MLSCSFGLARPSRRLLRHFSDANYNSYALVHTRIKAVMQVHVIKSNVTAVTLQQTF